MVLSKYFKCITDKPALSYKCGEKIVIRIVARDNCIDIGCQHIHWKIEGDDGQKKEGLGSCRPGKPLVLETSLSRPGFVHVTCRAYTSGGVIDYSFDLLEASAGAEVEKLEYCDTIPEDFDAYWQELETLVADFQPEVLYKKACAIADEVDVYDVRISTPEGRPASGYISIPRKEGKYPLMMSFMGYNVCGSPANHRSDAIVAVFNAHGIENDLSAIELKEKYYHELVEPAYGFDETENASNKTTYWRNMLLRNLVAAKYLKTLPQWDGERFVAEGVSQGALQATTLAAHDKDVSFLEIGIPWFCNLNAENHGYMAGWRPKYAEGLRYFDTVAQATRVTCPVSIRAYLGDYTCPPATIVVLYKAFKGRKSLDFIQAGNHVYRPPEIESYHWRYDPENPTGEVKKGIYRHYKGNEYRVLDTFLDSETRQPMVLYQALYGEGQKWARPQHMFNEWILLDDRQVKRFTYVGE